MMRSTTRHQLAEPGSSLDESTYELLGDSLLDASDDEGHTASVASTNGPTPEDTSDFSDDDNDYGVLGRDMYDSIDAVPPPSADHPLTATSTAGGEESTLTEGPVHMESSESWKIRLDEQPSEALHAICASKVIKSLPDQTDELPQVLHRYECAQVRLVVRAALSHHCVPTLDSYIVLYVGMPERWLEDIVTSQIGAALTASPSVSKSVMVRGQMEPYGPVIHVYRCAEIRTFAEREKTSHVLVILDDGRQLKFGPGLTSTSSSRPDLVVFGHPTPSSTCVDVSQFSSASEVFARESIPCIDLAQARPYGHGVSTDDGKALRVCLEGRNDIDAAFDLKEVLPLDYYTFSQLEPSQLNRHLAFISPHLSLARDASDTQTSKFLWARGALKERMKGFGAQWHVLKTLTSLLLFFALVPALLWGAAHAPLLLHGSSLSGTSQVILSQTLRETSSVAVVTPTSQVTAPAAALTFQGSASRDLTIVSSQTKSLTTPPTNKGREQGRYNIQVIGSHQFILFPSKDCTRSRRRPQLQIQVSRNAQVVPTRYNRTVNGEYGVELQDEYPVGVFNVSIVTLSKPLLRQTFEITLGHNKSKFLRLLDSIKATLVITQEGLRNFSHGTMEGVQTHLTEPERPICSWTTNIRWLKQKLPHFSSDSSSMIQTRAAHQLEPLLRATQASWNGVRRVTAPARTSSTMLKARMNALRLRCKLEMALGVTDGSPGEGQSWACSKVQRKV